MSDISSRRSSPHWAPRKVVLTVASATAVLAVGVAVTPALAGLADASSARVNAADNLASGRPATGSAACKSSETAPKAVNGSVSGGLADKWCSAAATKFLQVDLGASTAVTSFIVPHAQAGGESATLNTRDFDLQVSDDGTTFTTPVQVRGNTVAVSTHATNARGRYVRLNVIAGTQTGVGAARIYELEVYGTQGEPSTPPPSSPLPTTPATLSPPVQPPAGNCFPYPAHDPSRGPNPPIVLDPGVEPLDQRQMDAVKQLYAVEWPPAWQTFAAPKYVNVQTQGTWKVVVTNESSAWSSEAVMHIPRKDLVAGIDSQDFGSWMHEAGHNTQSGYAGSGVPNIFSEGIPDFIRFTARGEDPKWKVVDASQVGNSGHEFNADQVWSEGYALAARFMLWVTQKYDTSGNKYHIVAEFSRLLNDGDTNFNTLFDRVVGKSYQQLFQEYLADPKINPHC
jgi:hypothetical protein